MRGGFGGFSSAHMGGFGGVQRGFIGGGFGGFQRGFVGFGGFNRGFGNFSFAFGNRHFFTGRRFFLPRFGLYGSLGFGSYWPAYWPDYSYWPYDYLYSGYPYYSPSYYPPYQQPMTGSSGEEMGTSAPAVRYWLIALKDNTILLASDYWLEDSTLNYVTRDGKKSSVDLSKVDLDLTKELNQGRGQGFQLPRAKAEYQPPRRDAYGHEY